MNNVISIDGNRTNILFNEEKAASLVPTLLKITKKTKDRINILKSQLEVYKYQESKAEEIEEAIHEIIKVWGDKVSRLGMTPIGIWKVLIPAERPNEDLNSEKLLSINSRTQSNQNFSESDLLGELEEDFQGLGSNESSEEFDRLTELAESRPCFEWEYPASRVVPSLKN